MKTTERIEQLEADAELLELHIAELKAELLKEEKPFKVGDWAITDNSDYFNYAEVKKVTEVSERNGIAVNNERGYWDVSDVRHATPEEIKAHLIKEAEKRGYKEGVKVKCLRDWGTTNIKEYSSEEFYNLEETRLWAGGAYGTICIYQDGKWAEIIKDNKIKLNNEYEAEICNGGDVKVGCQTFTYDAIKLLYKAAKKKRDN